MAHSNPMGNVVAEHPETRRRTAEFNLPQSGRMDVAATEGYPFGNDNEPPAVPAPLFRFQVFQ